MQAVQEVSLSTSQAELVDLFTSFISKIGVQMEEREIHVETDLAGLFTENGILYYDLRKVESAGDILRLASRIAICRPEIRNQLKGDGIQQDALKGQREIASLLWTYAACIKLNISPEVVIHKDEAKGESAWLFDNFNRKNFIGLPLICSMGLTEEFQYPEMKQWLRA